MAADAQAGATRSSAALRRLVGAAVALRRARAPAPCAGRDWRGARQRADRGAAPPPRRLTASVVARGPSLPRSWREDAKQRRRGQAGAELIPDGELDVMGEDDRDRALRGIFGRLVGVALAPGINPRAIAGDRA